MMKTGSYVIGVLRGHLGFSESDNNVSEVLGLVGVGGHG